MSNHTPTPWVVVAREKMAGGNYPLHVLGDGDNKWQVCMFETVEGANFYPPSFRQLANAAHIVRCVNAHDELVAALRDIERYGGGDGYSVGIARAALAKVAA